MFCGQQGLSDALGPTLEFRSSSHHSLKCSVLGRWGEGVHANLTTPPLHSLQVSPLWKPHQYVHGEARDTPSHLLRLLWNPSESRLLSCGSLG